MSRSFCALALAILAYVPWIPQAIISVQQIGTTRESFLGLTPQGFLAALNTLVGNQDQGDYFKLNMASIWQMWEPLRVAMQVTVVATVILCVVLGWKALRLTLMVAGLLSMGTIAATVLACLVSPSFAPRTILTAVLGWAILVSMLVAGGRTVGWQWRWQPMKILRVSWVGSPILLIVLAVSVVSVIAANSDFSLQRGPRWSDLDADIYQAANANQDFHIVVPSKIDYVLMDVYKPGMLDGRVVTSLDGLRNLGPNHPDIWMAYHQTPAFQPFFDELARLGYTRTQELKYTPGALLFDRYRLAAQNETVVP